MKWQLKDIVTWTNGKLISEFDTAFDFIGSDTRKDLSGQIFIALKGDNYDAHDYLDQAVAAGAKALLVHRLESKFENLTVAED